MALVCLLARRLFRSNGAMALALCSVRLRPFVTLCAHFYSDTPFAPLPCWLCWPGPIIAPSRGPAAVWPCLACMAAAAFFGYTIKGSVVVVLAALILQLFLERGKQAAKGGPRAGALLWPSLRRLSCLAAAHFRLG